MKVCLINNLYGKYSVGGAEKVVQQRALKYKKEGNEVFIITSKSKTGLKIEKEIGNGIQIYYIWVPNIFYYKDLSKHNFFSKFFWHFIDIFNKSKIIKDILKQERPDVIETHNLMGIGYFQPITNNQQRTEIKWRHFLHDVQLVEPSGVLPWNHRRDNVWQKIYSWIMRRKFKGVDEVILPSEFLKKFYEERGFFRNATYHISRKAYHLMNNEQRAMNNNFLFIGSIVEHKGIRILMKVWDKVNIEKELHIVGEGILREEVEKWANEKSNVKVHGRLEGGELENIYKKCDTLIFPSICIENNPTVIHEAHTHGLRVIASDTGGVREIVDENDVLVEPGNVEKLFRHLNN